MNFPTCEGSQKSNNLSYQKLNYEANLAGNKFNVLNDIKHRKLNKNH